MGVEILQPAKTPPKVLRKFKKPVIKPVQKPEAPIENTIVVEPVQVQLRTTNAAVVRTATVQPQTISAFSNQALKPVVVNAPVNPNVSKVVNPHAPVPLVVTHTDAPVSDAPDALALSSPVVAGAGKNGGRMGRGIGGSGRGIFGSTVQVRITLMCYRCHRGLRWSRRLEPFGMPWTRWLMGLCSVILKCHPCLYGEPGGRVVGKGRDIRGVFRFTRLRHNLSDWWADASSLNAFTKWLNEKTQIRTDMNVEGGALKLTDANVMKSPMLIMTGHEPALAKAKATKRLDAGRMLRGIRDSQFSQSEAVSLRRYLVEKEGLLIFDDCGFHAAAQSMTRLFLTNMRYIMPEYHVGRIPNSHEIYHNFYQMGGPPIGFDIYQHGGSCLFNGWTPFPSTTEFS